MNNQGLLGALYQYWNINSSPRLYRRNTIFEEEVDNVTALKFGLVFIVLALAIVGSWCLVGGII